MKKLLLTLLLPSLVVAMSQPGAAGMRIPVETDLYAILHVTKEAPQESLTIARDQLRSNWGPDVFSEDEAKSEYALARIREIEDAYTILSSPIMRKQYDAAREAYLKKAAPQQPTQRAYGFTSSQSQGQQAGSASRPTPADPGPAPRPIPPSQPSQEEARPVQETIRGDVDLYAVLQAAQNAEPDMLEYIYRKLAQKYHPDSQHAEALKMSKEDRETKIKQINEAHRILGDPELRKRYDNARAAFLSRSQFSRAAQAGAASSMPRPAPQPGTQPQRSAQATQQPANPSAYRPSQAGAAGSAPSPMAQQAAAAQAAWRSAQQHKAGAAGSMPRSASQSTTAPVQPSAQPQRPASAPNIPPFYPPMPTPTQHYAGGQGAGPSVGQPRFVGTNPSEYLKDQLRQGKNLKDTLRDMPGKDQIRSLDLSGTKLTSLPPEIGDFVNLQYLHLSNNRLGSLPPEIGKLTHLRQLKLANNPQLLALPSEIGRLTELQVLFLPIGLVRRLPETLQRRHNGHYTFSFLRTLLSYLRTQPPSGVDAAGAGSGQPQAAGAKRARTEPPAGADSEQSAVAKTSAVPMETHV